MDNLEFAQKIERKSLDFAKNVALFCQKLPKDKLNLDYASQLNRSASSIGANYIEANESSSSKDFFHRIKICRKESKETKYWLELIVNLNPELNQKAGVLISEADEFLRLFSAILKKVH